MHKHRQKQRILNEHREWTLWEWWVFAMVASELIGIGIIAIAAIVVKLTGTVNLIAVLHIVGFLEGIILGLAQWLVLRHYIKHIGVWVVVTAIAGLVAWLIGTKMSVVLAFAYFAGNSSNAATLLQGVVLLGAWIGAVLGFAQWLVLEVRIRGAGWWIFANAVAWALGSLVAFLGAGTVSSDELSITALLAKALTGIATGSVIGAITGVALVWLLKPLLHQHNS